MKNATGNTACVLGGLAALLLLAACSGGNSEASPANQTATGGPQHLEIHCREPLPVFTLGENSNPTPEQQAALCSCIWQNLGQWAQEASRKIVEGKESEVSALDMRAYPARFGSTLKQCGGMKL